MNRRSRGFTLLELIIVIAIGTILTSMAVKGFGASSSALAVKQARNVFNGMVARTRAQAIESGLRTVLIANVAGDSVIILRQDGTVDENIRFDEELSVDLTSSAGNFSLCMSPRGYADTNCNSFSSTITISFTAGANTASLQILPLGQIRW